MREKLHPLEHVLQGLADGSGQAPGKRRTTVIWVRRWRLIAEAWPHSLAVCICVRLQSRMKVGWVLYANQH